jgi:hypothetical protein
VIDGLSGLHTIYPNVSYSDMLADAIRGFIEYEGSNLRMYYTVGQKAPGRRKIEGVYSVWRVGYQGQIAGIMTLLPELFVLLALGAVCVYYGVASKVAFLGPFDPSKPVCLIAASASGSSRGRLRLTKELYEFSLGRANTGLIRYDEQDGLVNGDEELEEVLLSHIVVGTK